MISRTLQIVMLLAVSGYFITLLHLLKRKRLNLKYSLLWMLSGVVMLLLALFPQMLNLIANLVGVYEPTNALFAIICFCIIMILMSLTAIVSKLKDQTKHLAQTVALLEKRLREQEGSVQ